MSVESGGALGALIYKIGIAKLVGLGAALIGAACIAASRPPQSRKELFSHAAVAIGASLLLGGLGVQAFLHYFPWASGSYEVVGAVYGLIGSISWGLFSGIRVIADKFSTDPIRTIKDIKDII